MFAVSDAWTASLARGYVSDWHSQEDLIQEGRIAAWRSLDRFDATKGSLGSWQSKAIRQRLLDLHGKGQWTGHQALRGKRPVAEVTSDETTMIADALTAVTHETTDSDTKLTVRNAVRSLDEPERRMLWLRFWRELTFDEIALAMEVTIWEVRQMWLKAKAALREMLS